MLRGLLREIYSTEELFEEAELSQDEYELMFTRKAEEQQRLFDAV